MNSATTHRPWRVITSSVRGSSHTTKGQPNQDAVAWRDLPTGGVVVAISDGHGSDRNPRSDRGSRLAVEAACQVAAETIKVPYSAVELEQTLRLTVLPATVDRWRAAVRADLDGDPLDADHGDPLLSYGATLLIGVATDEAVACAQIGDGDIIAVHQSADSAHLILPDARFVAGETPSLCLDDALSYARSAPAGPGPPALLFLATDGYANSFADEHWTAAVSADLLKHLRTKGPDWVQQRLDDWLTESAQVGGDDVTIAVLVPSSTSELASSAQNVAAPEALETHTPTLRQTPWTLPPERAPVITIPEGQIPREAPLATLISPPAPMRGPTGQPTHDPVGHAAPSRQRRNAPGLALAVAFSALALVLGFVLGRVTAEGGDQPVPSVPATTSDVRGPTTPGASSTGTPGETTASSPPVSSGPQQRPTTTSNSGDGGAAPDPPAGVRFERSAIELGGGGCCVD